MRTIRLAILLIPITLFFDVIPARGGEQGSEVFEMQDGNSVSEIRLSAPVSTAPSIQPSMVAMASTAGQNKNKPDLIVNQVQIAADEDQDTSSDYSYHFYFGAGASYWQPYRISDKAKSELVMPEFSVSFSPFGQFMEIGADIAIGDDSNMLVRSNLKFFSFETRVVSLYLEGSAAFYKCSSGTYWGGGAGAGLMINVMKHISLEIRAAAVVFDLTKKASAEMFGQTSQRVPLLKELANLVVIPSIGARTVARF